MKFTKYEAVGMFVSVGIMSLALFLLGLDTDILTQHDDAAQTAAAAAASGASVEERLAGAYEGGKLARLVIEDVRIGTGDAVQKGDTIEVHYEGRLQDGTRFDDSRERGESFTFTVGAGKVIAGMDQGVIGMQEGGERILVIPSRMAYGSQEVGVIPPNSPLVFMVELIDLK